MEDIDGKIIYIGGGDHTRGTKLLRWRIRINGTSLNFERYNSTTREWDVQSTMP